LATSDDRLSARVMQFKAQMAAELRAKDRRLAVETATYTEGR
jgi:hypothetical protein